MMKALPTLALAACALFMASCTSPIVKRIEHNQDLYNALSSRHKDLVQRGEIEEGMSKQAVYIAWGRPNRVSKGTEKGKTFERWSFTRYETVPTHSAGIGYGGAYGGYGGYYGPYGGAGFYDPVIAYEPFFTYVKYEDKKAVFLNNRVSAWSVVQ